ncbi:hypothetical protein ACFFVB_11025 [Formosa undariae]|uniref:Uncharacterized protein n=1 Tax=Formosa undariae TaxID=1325436 RepID=A0ABV5F2E5_9FLAO
MNYILTVKKTKERYDNITLDNSTSIKDRIEWNGQKYSIKEIIITNPEVGIIELKCYNISDSGKEIELTSIWN